MTSWLLLSYKVSSEPSTARVHIWRKLKRLGALLLHDVVWLLPATDSTSEQLQWLAMEIRELGGEVALWESHLVLPTDEAIFTAQFVAEVDRVYAELLAALRQGSADRAALARRYQQVRARDYFQSPLGQQVRTALLANEG